MKIEIDLDAVFRDGDGEPGESLEESIRRQIISRLTSDMRERLFKRVDVELSTIMRDQINAVMAEKMPALIEDILNVEYTPVDRYGSAAKPTTFRAELVASVVANMKYEPKQFSSDENALTRAVKSIVQAKTGAVKEEIVKRVDVQFKEDAIKFAVAKLSERLGLTGKS
jgi:hypothetical protein